MSAIQYSQVQPDNNRTNYTSLDVVNFTINNQGRSLVLGSLKLEGKLRINTTGNTRATNQDIRFNPNVGAGAFIDGISTATAVGGNLENIAFDYPRLLNMIAVASKDNNDTFSSGDICELKAPRDTITSEYCYGVISNTSTPSATEDITFSHKLKNCLNRQVQGDNLPFSQSGFIKVSVSLARDGSAVYGTYRNDANDNIGSVNYQLSDLVMSYQTVPDVGQKQAVVMRSVVPIKSTIESDFSNVSSSVPAKCDAVSISYQFQERENRNLSTAGNPQVWDNNALNKIPNWRSIQFIFNNSNSEYVSYIIDSQQEAVKRAIDSLKDSGHNQVNGTALDTNQHLIHGLSFGEMIDLSNQRFSIQIDAPLGVSSANPMILYAYFHSLVSA